MKTYTIFIGNILENMAAVLPMINGRERRQERKEDHALSERFLFSEPYHGKLLITSYPIDQSFFEDAIHLTGGSSVVNLYPERPTDFLSDDCINDKGLSSSLLRYLDSSRLILVSAAVTPGFYRLCSWLEANNYQVETPEAPDPNSAWVQSFFDSKVGFSQMSLRSQVLPKTSQIPRFIVSSYDDITGIAYHVFSLSDGVVLKTNRGGAGLGVEIFRKKDLEAKDLGKHIQSRLNAHQYWVKEPFVIEGYKEPDARVGGGQPSFEIQITKDRKIVHCYACGMRVSPEGVFLGIEFGSTILPENVVKQGFILADRIGRFYADLGYRGFFDVDMVYSNSQLYPLETNCRRTGGTHAFELARHLLGKDWEQNVTVSVNLWNIGKQTIGRYSELKKRIGDLFYPINAKKRGVFITSSRLLPQGLIGYIVIGESKKDAYHLEDLLHRRLQEKY